MTTAARSRANSSVALVAIWSRGRDRFTRQHVPDRGRRAGERGDPAVEADRLVDVERDEGDSHVPLLPPPQRQIRQLHPVCASTEANGSSISNTRGW
jgi:hypothetical protein